MFVKDSDSRYYGVLAPNSPFRASVMAMAGLSVTHEPIQVQSSDHNKEEEPIEQEQEQENKPKHPPNRYLWAMLLARIYNLFPLLCPECGAEMRVIVVIQDKPVINKILASVGEATGSPELRPEGSALGVSPDFLKSLTPISRIKTEKHHHSQLIG
ncbi:MAG: hypothetical protein GY694_21315 [Gammaproteobacteria bacterium]|nr:hypothetical protein [Gammaproteobacteria bacterium]